MERRSVSETANASEIRADARSHDVLPLCLKLAWQRVRRRRGRREDERDAPIEDREQLEQLVELREQLANESLV